MKKFNLSGIVGFNVSPDDVRSFLDDAAGEDIKVVFSSPGGLIDAGFIIYNAFRNYKGNKTAVLDGTVASIAAYISTAFENVQAEQNAVYMIHNAHSGVYGDYKVLSAEAKELERLNPHIGKSFAAKSGKSIEEIIGLMDQTTWFYGDEIKEAGFADSMVEDSADPQPRDNVIKVGKEQFNQMRNKVSELWHPGRVAVALNQLGIDPGVDPGKNNDNEGDEMNKEEILKHLQTLKANNAITMVEIGQALNLSDQLVTDEHVSAVKSIRAIRKAMNVDGDVVTAVEDLVKEMSDNARIARENKLDSLFGKDTELRIYAGKQLVNLDDASVAEFKKDPIAKRLAANLADQDSDENSIGRSEGGNGKTVTKVYKV